jgi:hypothetical protein
MDLLDKFNCRLQLKENIFPLAICIVLLIWSLKLYCADLRIPLTYEGDALLFYAWTKTIIENGWPYLNSFLGAPYGFEMYDFPLNNTLDVLLIKIISFFSSDPILVENLFYLLTFPLTTLTSMVVFRQFKINYAYSLLGSLLFTFMPYHFLRGVSHLNLSSYFMVPLMVMVILWVYSNELNLFKSNDNPKAKSLLSDNKLIASVIICILSGIVYFYYSYFFCLFLFIIGVFSSVSTRRKAPFITSILLILLVSLVVVLNQSPTIVYQYQNGNNPEVAVRSPAESEIYGLKIIQLLMPIDGHRVPILARFTRYYDSTAPLVNENTTASLGTIGSLGFLFLISLIFFRGCSIFSKMEYNSAILHGLSTLNLSAILFAAIGGFSSLTAYLVLAQFRAINRISIFIAFFSIYSILIVLTYISHKHIKNAKWNGWIYIIAGILLLIGVFDQTSDSFVPSYVSIKQEYLIDENFINSVEAVMPTNAMIFQLPYAPFPEYPPVNKMTVHAHFRGYLHSKDLHWSYGAMKGRSGDNWQRLVAGMPVEDMIKTLSDFGFSGIYIDSYGYEDGGAKLLSNIAQILEVKPVVSDNKRLYFFDMTKYKQQIKTNSSYNNNIHVGFNSGWHGIEDWSGTSTRWMQADAELVAFSPDNRTSALRMRAASFYRNRTLEVSSGGVLAAQIAVPSDRFINVSVPIHLIKGTNTVSLHVPEGCDRPSDKPELNNIDSRCLSVAVQNLTVT